MIIAALIMLLGGGGSSGLDLWMPPAYFTDQVQVVITDQDRQDKVMEIMNYMEDVQKDYASDIGERVSRFEKMLENKKIGDADFYAFLDEIMEERTAKQDKIMAVRLDLVNHITEDEWTRIFTLVDK